MIRRAPYAVGSKLDVGSGFVGNIRWTVGVQTNNWSVRVTNSAPPMKEGGEETARNDFTVQSSSNSSLEAVTRYDLNRGKAMSSVRLYISNTSQLKGVPIATNRRKRRNKNDQQSALCALWGDIMRIYGGFNKTAKTRPNKAARSWTLTDPERFVQAHLFHIFAFRDFMFSF